MKLSKKSLIETANKGQREINKITNNDLKNLKSIILKNEHVEIFSLKKKSSKKEGARRVDGAVDDKKNYRVITDHKVPYKNINKRLNNSILKRKLNCVKSSFNNKKNKFVGEGLHLFGGIENVSYVDNINYHSMNLYRCTIDIANFFPSIKYSKVRRYFIQNVTKEQDIATILSLICCYNNSEKEDISLGQGFCTSTSLCYLVNLQMFSEIQKYCINNGLRVSFFIDDISVSSQTKIKKVHVQDIINIMYKNKYRINDKTRVGRGVPIHNTKKYNNHKIQIKPDTKRKIKKVYDQLMLLKNEKVDRLVFKNLVIPMLHEYFGLYNSLKLIYDSKNQSLNSNNNINKSYTAFYKRAIKNMYVPYKTGYDKINIDCTKYNSTVSTIINDRDYLLDVRVDKKDQSRIDKAHNYFRNML